MIDSPDQSGRPLSIVVPVLNDAAPLRSLLTALTELPAGQIEILVVDGGSHDESRAVANEMGACLLAAAPGRGRQLNAGYRAARGEWIWFLHADSLPDHAAISAIAGKVSRTIKRAAPGWGRFNVCFDSRSRKLKLLATMMNWRSRQTGICTGDQGIFVHRRLLSIVGGVPELPLMEDVELSRRLGQLCRPECRAETLQTSARRWQQDGWLNTVLLMWRYRVSYWLGASAEDLAARYYDRP